MVSKAVITEAFSFNDFNSSVAFTFSQLSDVCSPSQIKHIFFEMSSFLLCECFFVVYLFFPVPVNNEAVGMCDSLISSVRTASKMFICYNVLSFVIEALKSCSCHSAFPCSCGKFCLNSGGSFFMIIGISKSPYESWHSPKDSNPLIEFSILS